jgi:hypothetical protein
MLVSSRTPRAGARFYDLTKFPAVCPKCGTEQPLPRRSGGRSVEDERPKKQAPALEDVDSGVEGLEDVGEEDDLEAADELEDDDAFTSDEVAPETDENER